MEAEFAEVKDRVRLTYVSKSTVAEVIDAVKAAPPHSLVLYLCSTEAEFVTGSAVTIDGGWTAT